MGDHRRIQRVEKEVLHLISSYVLTRFKEELVGFVAINRVVISRDLRLGKVYVSAFGDGADVAANVAILQDHAIDIQHYLNQQLRMKFCPRLTFYVDEMAGRLLKIEQELARLNLAAKRNKRTDAEGVSLAGAIAKDSE